MMPAATPILICVADSPVDGTMAERAIAWWAWNAVARHSTASMLVARIATSVHWSIGSPLRSGRVNAKNMASMDSARRACCSGKGKR